MGQKNKQQQAECSYDLGSLWFAAVCRTYWSLQGKASLSVCSAHVTEECFELTPATSTLRMHNSNGPSYSCPPIISTNRRRTTRDSRMDSQVMKKKNLRSIWEDMKHRNRHYTLFFTYCAFSSIAARTVEPKKEHSRDNFDLSVEGNVKDLSLWFPANCKKMYVLKSELNGSNPSIYCTCMNTTCVCSESSDFSLNKREGRISEIMGCPAGYYDLGCLMIRIFWIWTC